jgi:hypothetical protein
MKPKYLGDVDCVFHHHPEDSFGNKLLIGMEMLIQNRDDPDKHSMPHSRIFAVFENYVELYKYIVNTKAESRYFYEIILGEYSQKPHFDLDISVEQTNIVLGNKIISQGKPSITFEEVENILSNVIESIVIVALEHDVDLNLEKDILVYNSHGKNKYSYHIVVHHWCHSNHRQALGFYEKVCERCDETSRMYLDRSVYSCKQNFRLLASQKIGSGRPKAYNEEFTVNGKKMKHILDIVPQNKKHRSLEIFKESLVGWTHGCQYLPKFTNENFKKTINIIRNGKKCYIKKKKKIIQHDLGDKGFTIQDEAENELENNEIDEEEEYEEIIGGISEIQLQKITEEISKRKYPFTIREVEGYFIYLNRLAPSYCEICQRIHENENPYIFVTPQKVYLNCRRTKISLLLLESDEVIEDVNNEDELLDPEIVIDEEYFSDNGVSDENDDDDEESDDDSEEEDKKEKDDVHGRYVTDYKSSDSEEDELINIQADETLLEIDKMTTEKPLKSNRKPMLNIESVYGDKLL